MAPDDKTGLKSYLLSLPERALRSASAVSGGLLRELGDVAIPEAVRDTQLYRTMVDSTLRFMIEQVGQVEGTLPEQGRLGEDFAMRRAAGNGLELVGILAFRASPVWVMAALADASGAGNRLVREVADCLKQEGLLDPETEFRSVEHILDGLQDASGRVAEAINAPPLDVDELRREWAEIRDSVGKIPPSEIPTKDRLWSQWRELRDVARTQDRSVFELSTVIALSAVTRLPENMLWLSRSAAVATRRAGEILAEPLLDHYAAALAEIRKTGFLAYWSRQFSPYLKAAADQFSRERSTLTERLLRRRETP